MEPSVSLVLGSQAYTTTPYLFGNYVLMQIRTIQSAREGKSKEESPVRGTGCSRELGHSREVQTDTSLQPEGRLSPSTEAGMRGAGVEGGRECPSDGSVSQGSEKQARPSRRGHRRRSWS